MYIPWNRVLIDMPVVTRLVKKFPTFCGTYIGIYEFCLALILNCGILCKPYTDFYINYKVKC